MLQRPLPPVIDQIASSVANVVNSALPQAPVIQANESLPMLVLISKDLAPTDQAEFASFGNVVVWKNAWKNIPFAQLQTFDYLIVDMRMADARTQLAKEDMTKYNVVHYVTFFQRVEEYLKQIPGSVITDVPVNASSKTDFDQQLLNEPLVEPSVIKSLFRFFAVCGSK